LRRDNPRCGKLHFQAGATAWKGPHTYSAAGAQSQIANDGETEPVLRAVLRADLFPRDSRLKNPVKQSGRDAGARIRYPEHHHTGTPFLRARPRCVQQRKLNPKLAALWHGFPRILKQVLEDTIEIAF
jgi:hypothetical protein